ncbi:MAG: RidA family protein [Candidatus Dojkabacteria bacterium]
MKITHLNPDTMYKNPAFSQAVVVDEASKMIYIGGQNGVTTDGKMLEGIEAQSEQALKNVIAALEAADAKQENVVKLTIYIVQGNDLKAAFAASQKIWGKHATAIVGLFVAGLGNPEALIEIDAIAAV